MNKIMFSNPKGNTIYLANVGFDWGAFWAMFALGGLPFFLRKMNILGVFCLVSLLISTLDFGLSDLSKTVLPYWSEWIFTFLIIVGISLYLGINGGKLTARHYLEEGYKCVTKDEALLMRAKTKWEVEL